jgi:hypothetical protein
MSDEDAIDVPSETEFCKLCDLVSPEPLRQMLAKLSKATIARLVNSADSSMWTPLHWATSHQRLAQAELLLQHGADVNGNGDPSVDTPLHKACFGGKVELVRLLLEHGAALNSPGYNGESALSTAAKNGHLAVVQMLLDRGCATDRLDAAFVSSVRLANQFLFPEVAVRLFEGGADAHRVSQHQVSWARPYTIDTPPGRTLHSSAVVQGALIVVGGNPLEPENPPFWQLDFSQESSRPLRAVRNAAVSVAVPTGDLVPPSSSSPPLPPAPTTSEPPSCFVWHDAYSRPLTVSDGTRVEYTNALDVGVGATLSNVRLTPNVTDGIAFFEVTVLSLGRRGFIGIGVSGADVPSDKMIGWFEGSCAVHSDDGKKYVSAAYGAPFGPKFDVADVIGVGVNFVTREIFFTRNGDFVGVAHRAAPNGADIDFGAGLFGAVSLYSLGEVVEANFGKAPFCFSFNATQLEWSRPLLSGDVPRFAGQSWRIVSPDGVSALCFYEDFRLSQLVTMSGTVRKWHFERRFIKDFAENGRQRFVCCGDGVVYALIVSFAGDAEIRRLVHAPSVEDNVDFFGRWERIAVTERSPIASPKLLNACMVYMGDGLLAVVGGRPNAAAAAAAAAPNAAPVDIVRNSLFFFDVRRGHWLGYEQIDGSLQDSVPEHLESFLHIGNGSECACAALGSGRAAFFGGWDGRRIRSDFTVMTVTRASGDNEKALLSVDFSSPHTHGSSTPSGRNRASVAVLPDGRVAILGGWSGSSRSADLDIGTITAMGAGRTRLTRALEQRSFADVVLTTGDGGSFGVHRTVLQRRCRGVPLAPGASTLHLAAVKAAHLGCLLHYAYADELPDVALTSAEVRMFLECVRRLAPEHERRICERLVCLRTSIRSSFASDMAGSFSLERGAAGELFDSRLRLADGRTIAASRALLSAGSEFFSSRFEGPFASSSSNDVDLSDDDPALVIAVVEWICTGEVTFDDALGARVVELLGISCKFGCSELSAYCDSLIAPLIARDNARWLLCMALSLGRRSLADSCRKMLQRQFGKDMPTDEQIMAAHVDDEDDEDDNDEDEKD